MDRFLPITDIYAREILDSRGNPTIEVEVLAGERYLGSASVPSGASTGKFEAVELRDGEVRYKGKGVELAVDHVNAKIAPELIGRNIFEQEKIDQAMICMDGTENKSNLGANAILGVSLAVARTAAIALGLPLYAYLGGVGAKRMPVPMMNIMNGGKHAYNTIDVQEFMIMPVGAKSFREGLRMCTEVYHTLKELLQENGMSTAVGDEGGFAPDLADTKEVMRFLVEAIKKSGYRPGADIVLALDVAASELYDAREEKYRVEGESKMKGKEISRSSEEMVTYYQELALEFPVVSIEDPLDEEDWDGWKMLTERLGGRLQLVGDDLFVTNKKRLQQGIENNTANAVLVKVNQIGTLSEAIETVKKAHQAGYRAIISHRSGETVDPFIADLAVALNAGQIKTGAPCRGERVEKYNRLLRIEEKLGEIAVYENPFLLAISG